MIEYYTKKKNEKDLIKVQEYSKNCWINVVDPNEKEIEFLINKFKLDKNNLLDGLDIHENSRVEIEDKTIYIYLTTPTERISPEYDCSFLVIYSKDFFMTFSKNSLEVIEKLLSTKRKLNNFSFSRNLLDILFLISRMFELSVRKTIKEIKKNKKDLNTLKNEDIVKLIQEEDKLNQYISSFGTIMQTYHRVIREKTLKLFKKDEETIEDLIIDLHESLTLCKYTLKSITNMRDYYSTKISNDLNKKVTLLTIFTIFLTIPTLIAGVYGMNITLPFQTHPGVLGILAFLIIAIWGLMFFILKTFKVI